MTQPLRVYGWQGWRPDCPPAPNGGKQTREIVAAPSKAAAARAAGVRGPHALWNLTETDNGAECAIARTEPGVVFWCPLDRSAGGAAQFRRAAKP